MNTINRLIDTLLEPQWFPFFMLVMYAVASLGMSHMSGWAMLAKQYRLAGRFYGERRHFQSGEVGPIRFVGTLIVGVNSQGLYLGVFALFRLGFPRLLIPWTHVSRIQKQRVLLAEFASLDIDGPKKVTIRIPWSFIETARPSLTLRLI